MIKKFDLFGYNIKIEIKKETDWEKQNKKFRELWDEIAEEQRKKNMTGDSDGEC